MALSVAVLACEAKFLDSQTEDMTLACRSNNGDVFDHSRAGQDIVLQSVLHGYTRISAISCS